MAFRRGWIPVFLRALPHSTGVTAQLRVSLRRPACSWAASTFRGSNESSRMVSTSWSSRDTTYKGGKDEDCLERGQLHPVTNMCAPVLPGDIWLA